MLAESSNSEKTPQNTKHNRNQLSKYIKQSSPIYFILFIMAQFVYLVFYQQETHYYSLYNGYPHFDNPDNVNKDCIGVYRTESAAHEAALDYWVNNLGMDEDDGTYHEWYNDGHDYTLDFFWDGLENGEYSFTLSERVYVKKEKLK